eukprot:7342459-Pyramimonas_sp.AAC.1
MASRADGVRGGDRRSHEGEIAQGGRESISSRGDAALSGQLKLRLGSPCRWGSPTKGGRVELARRSLRTRRS